MRLAPWLIALAACSPATHEPPPRPPEPRPTDPITEQEPEPEPKPEPMPADPAPEPSPTPDSDPPTANVEPYDRDTWPLWIDADHDCQDTRTEVLIAESEIPVTFTTAKQCTVATGRWRCPYTDRTFTDPKLLDIDHLVPLEHAHDSGGSAWTKQKRTDFANALEDPDHLVAVYRSSNRSKGSRSVDVWLPEEPGFRCQYVDAWRRIKAQWKLRESKAERAAIDDALAKCRANDVPDRPTTPAKAKTLEVRDPPSGACCKVCKAGKACGDGCIAKDKSCKKPPGCAC